MQTYNIDTNNLSTRIIAWKRNIPIIASITQPAIATFNKQRYVMPGWIPIKDDVTYTQILNQHITIKDPEIELSTPFDTMIPGSNENIYKVSMNKYNIWSCECKGYMFRRHCKHIDIAKSQLQQI
jgi:hypothetical protein